MYEWRRVDVFVVVIPWIQPLKYSHMCTCIVHLYLFFSTMPEFYIDGLSTFHNSSKKMNDFEINNVTSSSLMVTERSQNSTTATSNPDTTDSGNLFSGIVILIIFFLFCFGHYHCHQNFARQEKTNNEYSRKSGI